MSLELLAGAAGAWVWENYGKAIFEKMGEKAKDKWTAFNWKKAAEKYREALFEDYGKVRLLGSHESVELEGIFTDVFILDKVSAFQRFDIADLEQEPEKLGHCERHNGFELIKQDKYKRWFILGKPGAGKTTFLKYITLQAVKGQLDKVPFFISLHRWANVVRNSEKKSYDLMPYLVEQFKICNFPDAQPFIEHLLKEGKALLLFDGLDEVNQADDERAKMLHALSDFCREHRNCTVLLTCRVAAADYSLQEQFTYLEVADFTEEQISSFVKKWFSQDAERGERFLTDFASEQHRGLRELASVPILLTLLCLTYARKMEFPERRADIYEEAIEALVETWDSKYRNIKRDGIYQGLSKRHKLQLFSRIAAEAFQNNKYFFEKKPLAEKIAAFLKQLPNSKGQEIDGENVLEAIAAQHGIFVERAKDIYSFAHLSFQEYFTARYIFENQAYGTLENLALHVHEDRWREVFLLTASLLDNADSFFTAMQKQIDNLIADEPELIRLAQWVNQKAQSVETNDKPAAVRSFYYYFVISLSLANLQSINRIHFLTNAKANANALLIALDFVLSHANTIDLARNSNNLLTLDGILMIIISSVKHFQVLSIEKQHYADYFQLIHETIGMVKRLHLTEIAEQLTAIAKKEIPDISAPYETWEAFEQTLKALAQQSRNIGHDWEFSDEQIEKLAQYLAAHSLLVKCLSLATVSDREAIKNKLLLVPELLRHS